MISSELEQVKLVIAEGGENLFITAVPYKGAWTCVLSRRDKKPTRPEAPLEHRILGLKPPKAPKRDATVLAFGFGKTKEKALQAMATDAMARQGDYLNDMHARIQRKKRENSNG